MVIPEILSTATHRCGARVVSGVNAPPADLWGVGNGRRSRLPRQMCASGQTLTSMILFRKMIVDTLQQ